MVGRNPVRFLVPVVLVVIVIGAALIIANHTGSSGSSSTAAHVVNHQPRGRGKYANATFYTVQPGDTLTTIAAKTGIPVLTLEQLNQSLDPNSLQTGLRLRLRR
jgi:spore germination protein YaaH